MAVHLSLNNTYIKSIKEKLKQIIEQIKVQKNQQLKLEKEKAAQEKLERERLERIAQEREYLNNQF